MNNPVVRVHPFTQADLLGIVPWFEDPDTQRFLGGPDWATAMLGHADRSIGTTFRGARQTGAHRYLASAAGTPVGYIDCGNNHGSRAALQAAGFRVRSPTLDCEGMLYYHAWTIRPAPASTCP